MVSHEGCMVYFMGGCSNQKTFSGLMFEYLCYHSSSSPPPKKKKNMLQSTLADFFQDISENSSSDVVAENEACWWDSETFGARGLKRSTCYDSPPWNNRETTLKYVWSCFEKVFILRLGFKYSKPPFFFLSPIYDTFVWLFFPLKLGILVFIWGCWRHPTCHLWHQSFLQGLALRVGWMLEAIEGFGGCLVGWFPSFHCFHTYPIQGTNMFDLGKMNIIFKHACNLGDMLVPWKVHGEDFGLFTHQSRVACPWKTGMIYFSDLGEDAKWNFNFH